MKAFFTCPCKHFLERKEIVYLLIFIVPTSYEDASDRRECCTVINTFSAAAQVHFIGPELYILAIVASDRTRLGTLDRFISEVCIF